MKYPSLIPVRDNNFAMVDPDDVPLVIGFSWKLWNGYASAKAAGKGELMHRVIMKAKAGEEVDHKNGNGLDNRKSNLRICNHHQNTASAIRIKRKSGDFSARKIRATTSIHRGVSFRSDRQRWTAYIGTGKTGITSDVLKPKKTRPAHTTMPQLRNTENLQN